MHKIVFALATAIVLSSCGNANKEGTETGAADTEKKEAAADPQVEKGLQLIAGNDCLGCHKVADAFTGPAYEAIAAKYDASPAVIDTLAGKIISGGAGNWGQIPMTPHPTLSKDDARSMVKYILSLKK